MKLTDRKAVTVLSRDVIVAGREDEVRRALDQLIETVRRQEPETLAFQAYTGFAGDRYGPQADPRQVTIVASYQEIGAYFRYLGGAVFEGFAAEHGRLFVCAGGKPFANFESLSTQGGFDRGRPEAGGGGSTAAVVPNRHPGVMFEVIANHQPDLMRFYQKVFGWQFRIGTGGFAYVDFAGKTPPLLGGIGQAQPDIPGFEPGHSFYLLVDDLNAFIARAESAGGKQYMPPAEVDGYHFAMIQDPEGNPVGLIEPFEDRPNQTENSQRGAA